MNSTRMLIAGGLLVLVAPHPALAQGPCDLLIRQAAQVMGAPAGKTERLSPVKNIEICEVRSADSLDELSLTLESSKPAAQGVAMSKMIAKMSKDIGQFRDEAGLGPDAFSLRETGRVTFRFGAGSNTYNLQLTRDRGVTDADVERTRQFATRMLAFK